MRVDVPESQGGRRVYLFWTCRTVAVAGACVLSLVLALALQNQEMQEHGVVEQAVVTGESTTTVNTDSGTSSFYYYSLRALSGPAIRGTLDGPSTLSVGQRITVLADPRGLDDPTLTTGVSAGGQFLAVEVLAGIVAASVFTVTSAATTRNCPGRYGGAGR